MLLKALVVISGVLVIGIECRDFYSDLNLFHELQRPYRTSWEWSSPGLQSRSSDDEDRDREPLGPDYKDPIASSSEQKPLLQPNPKPAGGSQPPKAPSEVLPGGVIEVEAGDGVGVEDPFGIFRPSFDFKPLGFGDLFPGLNSNQWWKGKNVCIDREESTDDDEDGDDDDGESEEGKKNTTSKAPKSLPDLFSTSISLSNCFETANKYECITKVNNHGVFKTFTVRYKCCYGYSRSPGSGCTKKADLKPILDTLEDLKTDEFRKLIKSSGLQNKFADGNFSLFVPSDDGLNEYNEEIAESNNVDALRRRRASTQTLPSRDLVLSHTVEGFIDLTDFANDEVINSEYRNSTIRINIYPTNGNEKLVTVNCARVKNPNILAQNGIVHVTDRVVLPATEDVETIIRTHPRLSNLRKALEFTDIPSHLKPEGHYTVFAPTDEAFNKLDQVQKRKLLDGAGCASSILKYHFTAHTVCTSAIIGNATTHNVEGDNLSLERTVDDEIILEGKARITEGDIVATNGVIHLIDNIIIPDSGLYIGSVLQKQNFTSFQDLIKKAGLEEEINSLQNATVFVPTNKAFEDTETQNFLKGIENDQEKLKEIVRYHTVKGQLQSGDMNNNELLETYDDGEELRINLYSTLPLFTNVINRATVNCARLIGFDEKACGSSLHEVNKLLVPPTRSILDIIHSDGKYSTLSTLLQGSEVEEVLRGNNGSITFLAPTDETFAALDENDLKVLKENKDKANFVLKNHVLTEVLCCSGVGPQSWGFNSYVSTLANTQVEVGRTGSRVRINRAVVTSCDNLATNGILHTINKVLLPRQPQTASLGGLLFFDI
ncbi:unnamed protein product [Phaedon cochleariae]|uniref:FAS1 domain-containing protein n=1 Tax=Phaedon cochleariae TaxID=80249 RepID=A0A9N9SK89_PHACE|nr:unnamed protein product [Phaedon cochleariae]